MKEIVKAVRKTAKEKGAKKVEISVDCVAYAPHRRMDVQDWDVDFCVFSFYKVCCLFEILLQTLYCDTRFTGHMFHACMSAPQYWRPRSKR